MITFSHLNYIELSVEIIFCLVLFVLYFFVQRSDYINTDTYIVKDMQPQYSGEEMAVFLILNYLQNNKHNKFFVSTDTIGYYLAGRFIDSQKDKNLIKGIKKGLESLIKEQDIVVFEQNRNSYLVDSKSCYIDTKEHKFVIVKLWEIQRIFSSTGAYGFGLLRFWVNIAGTINRNSKSWHMTQDDMVNNWNMSKNTVNEYLRKLEELKLLYIFRSKARKMDETFHRVGNVYGRYCDKDLIIQEGIQYLKEVPHRPIQDYFIDRTSIKLRYNYFCKGSKKYKDNPELVRELYKDCIKYNESLRRFPNKDIDFLDLSVFKDYGFEDMPPCKDKNTLLSDSEQWGEPDPMQKDYSIEEIFEMPTVSEVQTEGSKTDDTDLIDIDSLYEEDTSLLDLY